MVRYSIIIGFVNKETAKCAMEEMDYFGKIVKTSLIEKIVQKKGE